MRVPHLPALQCKENALSLVVVCVVCFVMLWLPFTVNDVDFRVCISLAGRFVVRLSSCRLPSTSTCLHTRGK